MIMFDKRQEIEGALNEENRAMWKKLQYRFRNYIANALRNATGDLNEQAQPLILHYYKNYERLK